MFSEDINDMIKEKEKVGNSYQKAHKNYRQQYVC